MDNDSKTFYLGHLKVYIAILGVCFFVYAASKFYKSYTYISQQQPNFTAASTALDSLKRTMEMPLWNISTRLAESSIESIKNSYPQITKIEVLNVSGKVFLTHEQEVYSEAKSEVVSGKVVYGKDFLGIVNVFYEPTNPITYAFSSIANDIIYFLIQITALVVFTWLILFKRRQANSSSAGLKFLHG